MLQGMSQSWLTPNPVSYSAVTSACEKGLQGEAALGVLQGMSQRSLKPDAVSYVIKGVGGLREARFFIIIIISIKSSTSV